MPTLISIYAYWLLSLKFIVNSWWSLGWDKGRLRRRILANNMPGHRGVMSESGEITTIEAVELLL